jgi:hypothetical protein
MEKAVLLPTGTLKFSLSVSGFISKSGFLKDWPGFPDAGLSKG